MRLLFSCFFFFFFFNDTATTEIYTLSLHDALPISCVSGAAHSGVDASSSSRSGDISEKNRQRARDRKSTRLNSSHMSISYAVFCLKKKKNKPNRKLIPQTNNKDHK